MDTSLRVHASWFTSSIDIGLAITNRGTSALVIHPDRFRLTDRVETLRPYPGRPPPRCDGHDHEPAVTLPAGKTCRMFAGFEVQPDRSRLRTLMLTFAGATRDGVGVPVDVKFELD